MSKRERILKALKALELVLSEDEIQIESGYDGQMWLTFKEDCIRDEDIQLGTWDYMITKSDVTEAIKRIKESDQ